jgi:hypothetical protein
VFGKPGHGALEAMAVQVGQARKCRVVDFFPGGRHGIGFDRDDPDFGSASPSCTTNCHRPANRFICPRRNDGFESQKSFLLLFSKKEALAFCLRVLNAR